MTLPHSLPLLPLLPLGLPHVCSTCQLKATGLWKLKVAMTFQIYGLWQSELNAFWKIFSDYGRIEKEIRKSKRQREKEWERDSIKWLRVAYRIKQCKIYGAQNEHMMQRCPAREACHALRLKRELKLKIVKHIYSILYIACIYRFDFWDWLKCLRFVNTRGGGRPI